MTLETKPRSRFQKLKRILLYGFGTLLVVGVGAAVVLASLFWFITSPPRISLGGTSKFLPAQRLKLSDGESKDIAEMDIRTDGSIVLRLGAYGAEIDRDIEDEPVSV